MPSFLRIGAVVQRTSLSRSTIYAMIRRGEFPEPIRIGARASAWSIEAVETWEQSRRDAGWTKIPTIKRKAA